MNAPLITPATIRGRAALDEVRALFDQLYLIDSDIAELESWESKSGPIIDAPFRLTFEELQGVIENRRGEILNKLENKGIRIAPDPFPTPAPVADQVTELSAA